MTRYRLGQTQLTLFAMPHSIAIDDHDNVWLTDVAFQQVYKFSADGRLLLTLELAEWVAGQGTIGPDQVSVKSISAP